MNVAELHIKSLNYGFLSSLGKKFLYLFYEAIDNNDNCILITINEGKSCIGFIAGSKNSFSIYIYIISRFHRLLFALIPLILSPRKIYKIFEIIFFHSSSKKKYDFPELMTFAVCDKYRGTGRAEELYKKFLSFWRDKDEEIIKIVVGKELLKAQWFYSKMGAKRIETIKIHNDQESYLYLQNI
tara:strand:- start:885 stop:1436 length:552 start_codon:yes stop_codon:yes gene_type:complete